MEKNPRPNLVGSPKMDSQSSVLRDLCVSMLVIHKCMHCCQRWQQLGLFPSIQKEPPPSRRPMAVSGISYKLWLTLEGPFPY